MLVIVSLAHCGSFQHATSSPTCTTGRLDPLPYNSTRGVSHSQPPSNCAVHRPHSDSQRRCAAGTPVPTAGDNLRLARVGGCFYLALQFAVSPRLSRAGTLVHATTIFSCRPFHPQVTSTAKPHAGEATLVANNEIEYVGIGLLGRTAAQHQNPAFCVFQWAGCSSPFNLQKSLPS